jgi:hypothetical protein
MGDKSRDLRDKVVRGLSKVGLIWALAVLGALFTSMSAQAQSNDAGSALSAQGISAQASSFGISLADAPGTAGLALVLMILGGGVAVLAIGVCRGEQETDPEPSDSELDPRMDLSLALGLSLFA